MNEEKSINRVNGREEYVVETAKLLDLTIAPEYLPTVVENWLAIVKIASLVTDFELSEDWETATVFQPEEVN